MQPTQVDPDVARTADDHSALIEEARRRARRRRLSLVGLIGIGLAALFTVSIGMARTANDVGSDIPPGVAAPDSVDSAPGPVDVAADDLVASMWVRGRSVGLADGKTMWLYLYGDGRMITRTFAPGLGGDDGWFQRRLTPDGVALVVGGLLDSGAFDADPLSSPNPVGGWSWANMQVRNAGTLVFRERHGADPSLDGAIQILARVNSWLPATAWADAESTVYRPSAFVVCGGVASSDGELLVPFGSDEFRTLLPRDALAVIDATGTPPEIPVDADQQFAHRPYESSGEDCRILTPVQAQTVADSIAAAGWVRDWDAAQQPGNGLDGLVDVAPVRLVDRTGSPMFWTHHSAGTAVVGFSVILPHGVVEPAALD